MTKKDYILIADAVRNAINGTICAVAKWNKVPDVKTIYYRMVWQLEDELQKDNPRFDKQKFEDYIFYNDKDEFSFEQLLIDITK